MSTSPIHTRIWHEEPEPDNPYATRRARCAGYDVYGEMLGRAGWADMFFLLLRGELPTPAQARLLQVLAVALANPGPRDPSVHAAMCGGVGGSNAAASLMAALAVGAGQCGGAREVFEAMVAFEAAAGSLSRFSEALSAGHGEPDDVWPAPEHPPGFDPHGVSTTRVVEQTLAACLDAHPGQTLAWLAEYREALERAAGRPLSLTGVAAAALLDLRLSPPAGEMAFLLLRLPGAAAHALEQWEVGFKRFPFYPIELLDDPEAPGGSRP